MGITEFALASKDITMFEGETPQCVCKQIRRTRNL
jgi:hypothetical protein